MRLVFISDTHCQHEGLKLPEGDTLIHCGDFCGRGTLAEVCQFNHWLNRQDFKYKIVIAGNHDRPFQESPEVARTCLTNCYYLQDSGVELEGVLFWGSPWQPEFCNWAFNLPRGSALASKWQMIPMGANVVVTHGPPKGLGDRCHDENVGCDDLYARLAWVKPEIHACGHIHEGYGTRMFDGVTYVNASTLDGSYRRVNPPIVVEI